MQTIDYSNAELVRKIISTRSVRCEMAAIPNLNVNDVLRQINIEFTRDFETIFNIDPNGGIHCRNVDIPLFNEFMVRYNALFIMHDMLLNNLVLEVAGQGEIQKVKLNKRKILGLYGVSFQLYQKACVFTGRQLNPKYGSIVTLVKIEFQ